MRVFLILLVMFFAKDSTGQSPWYYGSGKAVNLENVIQYKNGVQNITGSLNPTSSAVNAPAGSLYESTNGSLYVKQDAGSSTNWFPLVTGPSSGTDNCIATFDAAGNRLQCNSTATITDASVFSITGQMNVDNLRQDGNTISSTDANGAVNVVPNGTGSVVLGAASVTVASTGVVSGITQLSVDNLRLDGNTMSSTNAGGDIIVTPSTTGNIGLGLTPSSAYFLDMQSPTDDEIPLRISTVTAATAAASNAGVIRAVTSGDMADEFGAQFIFQIRDSAATDNNIMTLRAARDGADNSGKFSILTRNAGVSTSAVTVRADGKVGVLQTVPLQQLHVANTASASAQGVRLQNSEGSADILTDGDALQLSTIADNGNITAVPHGTGNIGLGTISTYGAFVEALSPTNDESALRSTISTVATASVSGGQLVRAITSGNMADDFGVATVYQIRDDAGVDNNIGSTGFARDGGDTSGKFQVVTRNSGSFITPLTIKGNGSVWIGTSSGNADAALQVDSTTQYLLPPRHTTAQRTAMTITTADDGGKVYDTDLDEEFVVKNGAWRALSTDSTPGMLNAKTCYYGFVQSGGSLASPTECTSGTCGEAVDTCGTGSPPAWATIAVYSDLTFSAGTWANSSLVDCSCQAWDTTTSDPKQCRMYFVTSDNSWTTTASGGYVANMTVYNESGTQETAYVLVRCTAAAP